MSDQMKDKTVIVTGGNNGIGLETAVGLSTLGAHVVITARNQAKGEAALTDIKRRSGSDSVELMLADFASLSSIRDFAANFKTNHDRLDVLVNNAGGINTSRSETLDGFETTFGVNHLGYFLVTNLLLDLLKASAPARVGVRIFTGLSGLWRVPGLEYGAFARKTVPYHAFRFSPEREPGNAPLESDRSRGAYRAERRQRQELLSAYAVFASVFGRLAISHRASTNYLLLFACRSGPADHVPGRLRGMGPEDDTSATGRRVAFRSRDADCEEQGATRGSGRFSH